MAETEEYTLIHRFRKNAMEEEHVGLTEYRGHPLIDIRSHYEADGGTWKPTRKGIAFSRDALPELAEAVKRLRDAVEGGQAE